MAFFAVKGASPSTTNVKPKLLFLTHGKDVMIYPRVRELFLQDFGGVEVIGAATIRTRENLYHHMRMHDCSFSNQLTRHSEAIRHFLRGYTE